MSSLLTWRINGLDLDDFASFGLIVEPSMWRAPVSTRMVSIEIPGRHGVLSPGLPVFEAPLITLSVWRAGTQAQIEEATNALVAVLTQPTVTVTRESAGLVTSAPAKLVSIGFENFLVDTTSRATAVLRVPSVFFRGSIEATAEVRRNLIQNPRGTGVVAGWSLNHQWAGSGGTVTVTTEGTPVTLPDGTQVPSFRRKTWTVTPSAGEFIAWQFFSTASNRGAVTAGTTHTVQYAWRKSFAGTVTTNRFQILFYDAESGGTQVGTTINGATLNNPAPGVWQQDSIEFTVPAGATHCTVAHVYTISDPAILVPGVTFDATAALAEVSPSAGKYFDGGYSPVLGLIPAWTGTVNASESTLSTGSETSTVFTADLVNTAIHHLAGSTAPITDPIIRITGPCTNPTITDPTTGTGISWTGTVAASTYLYLHPDRLTARTSASDTAWLSGGTNVSSGIDYPAPGPLQLWPMVDSFTSRTIRLSATGTGKTAATRLTVRAARSFL